MPAPVLPVRDPGTPAARPKEAATLIIHRRAGKVVEVLMGERHGRHRFMPQRYAFPGGRVDPTDSRVRVGTPFQEHVAHQLQRKLTEARARAMGAAAIRETFEETGLMIGVPDPEPGRPVPGDWRGFFDTGMAPALDKLDYIARAVTPVMRPIRFNARFFMVESRHVTGDLSGSGELLDLRWFPVSEAIQLELPMITRRVLAHIDEIVPNPPPRTAETPVPFFKHIGTGHIRLDE